MKLDRTKNAKRNMIAGAIQKLITLLLPFVLRTLLINTWGVEYAGLNSLFASILNVLSLAELGFGSAIVYAMYGPIARNDTESVKALLNFYKKCYRIIGLIIFSVGLILLPFVPKLISGEPPQGLNIYTAYLIALSNVSISYFVYAYKSSLLYAFQRNDLLSWVGLFATVFTQVIQIVVIIVFRDFYVYMIVSPVMNVIHNLLIAYITKKKYPAYSAEGEIEKDKKEEIKRKVKSLFLYQIGNVVSNQADNIVISSFLGLSVLAIYGNYYFVITALFGFLAIYYSSVKAGLGNKMALESKESVYELFRQMFFIQGLLVGWVSICLVCLYQDFILLWMKDPEMLLDFKMVVLIAVFFYSWKINDICTIFKDATGLWEYDRLRPLIAALSNLVINIILVQFIGLFGVVLSTIVCELSFSMLWGNRVLFSHYFGSGFREYILSIIKYTVVTVIVGIITYFACSQIIIGSYLAALGIKLLICIAIPGILYTLIYHKNALFWVSLKRLKSMFTHAPS